MSFVREVRDFVTIRFKQGIRKNSKYDLINRSVTKQETIEQTYLNYNKSDDNNTDDGMRGFQVCALGGSEGVLDNDERAQQ